MSEVAGTVAPKFQAARAEFERNLTEHGELGSSFCVTVDGETVVDLWGGLADETTDRPWAEDTLSVVFSVSKAMAASCLHKLIAAGEVDLDKPIAKYWPEFAQNGKKSITVRTALAQSAHVAMLMPPVPGSNFDWDLFVENLAQQTPTHTGSGLRLPRWHRQPSLWRDHSARHRYAHRHLHPEGDRRTVGHRPLVRAPRERVPQGLNHFG